MIEILHVLQRAFFTRRVQGVRLVRLSSLGDYTERVGRPRACPQWPALMREDTRAETALTHLRFEFDFGI